tara:strand:+ start:1352 stop:1999 length:648 start_codon:yes stop_codon:yes gene_type:complete
MAKFKQEQIIPGVTKTRSNAIKVHCGAAIAENDIIVATGMEGDFLSCVPADNTDITKCRGPFFVADFAGASGEFLPLALPYKVITDKNTSAAAQVGDAVYLSTGGDVTLGAVPAATADGAAFSANVRVGRITKVDASAGAYVLEPSVANGAPIVGKVTCSGTSSTVTGFTAELNGAPVVVSMDANIATTGAVIAAGTLTIHHASSTDDATYAIFA